MPEDDVLCNCPSCRAEREGLPPGLDRMMEELGPDVVMQALEEIIGGGAGEAKKATIGALVTATSMPAPTTCHFDKRQP